MPASGGRRGKRLAEWGFWRFFTPSGHVCIIYSFCSGGSDSEPGASIFPIQQEELQGVPQPLTSHSFVLFLHSETVEWHVVVCKWCLGRAGRGLNSFTLKQDDYRYQVEVVVSCAAGLASDVRSPKPWWATFRQIFIRTVSHDIMLSSIPKYPLSVVLNVPSGKPTRR